jgi:hypothetical protein
MAVTDEERLRKLLGESIPDGGSEDDTLFKDDEITDLIDRAGSVDDALAEGWAMKAGMLVTLVTTVEGSSTRKLSDAYTHALAQAKLYGGEDGTITTGTGRVKVRSIERTARI